MTTDECRNKRAYLELMTEYHSRSQVSLVLTRGGKGRQGTYEMDVKKAVFALSIASRAAIRRISASKEAIDLR
jgi:hypothetical protein